jgi:hypothetical protein
LGRGFREEVARKEVASQGREASRKTPGNENGNEEKNGSGQEQLVDRQPRIQGL